MFAEFHVVREDSGRFTSRSHTARILSCTVSVGFLSGENGHKPLCMIPNNSSVDEAAEIECLRSELGHDG